MTDKINIINRRRILGGGAAGLLSIVSVSAQTPIASRSSLKVSITNEGAVYNYPDGPFMPSYDVGFRQDGRIVFHLGTLGVENPTALSKPYHLGRHHVRIEDDGKLL